MYVCLLFFLLFLICSSTLGLFVFSGSKIKLILLKYLANFIAMPKLLSPCFSNQISSLTNGDGTGDWSSMRDTLTNVFLGDNDLTELPKERSGNGNGDNNNGNNNNHHNGNGNGNGGGTEAGNGSGASLAECRMLTWLNLDSNKVHYTECSKFAYV